jgi:iron-sulfur cluster assembly accessory protein
MLESNVSETGVEAPIALTAKAVEHLKIAMQREGATGQGVRVAVRSGGCSGFEYHLAFAAAPTAEDTVYEVSGVPVFIDAASQQYLDGVTIDYVSGLHGAGFKFLNPNASRTCGCGSSFSA